MMRLQVLAALCGSVAAHDRVIPACSRRHDINLVEEVIAESASLLADPKWSILHNRKKESGPLVR